MKTIVVEQTVEQIAAPAKPGIESPESQNQEQMLLPISLAELEALIRRVVREEVNEGLTRFHEEEAEEDFFYLEEGSPLYEDMKELLAMKERGEIVVLSREEAFGDYG